MNKINVLIVEDDSSDGEQLSGLLNENGFHVVAIAKTNMEALNAFSTLPVDIIIIDIFLNGRPEGIYFAEAISAMGEKSRPFVFLTSSKDRAIFERAKVTQPYSFLLKPYNDLELLYSIELALEKYYDQQATLTGSSANALVGSDHLFVKHKRSLKKVLFEDILYVQVEERYCTIHTVNQQFVVFISLIKMASILEGSFIRTHRSFLVNTSKIREIRISEDSVVLDGDVTVPLSANYKKITKNLTIIS